MNSKPTHPHSQKSQHTLHTSQRTFSETLLLIKCTQPSWKICILLFIAPPPQSSRAKAKGKVSGSCLRKKKGNRSSLVCLSLETTKGLPKSESQQLIENKHNIRFLSEEYCIHIKFVRILNSISTVWG